MENKKYIDDIVVENARIIFRNFRGEAGDYNPAGNRNFSVVFDNPEHAEMLRKDGWNIKPLKPRDEDDENPGYYMQVRVNFDILPPTVYMVTRRKKTRLNERTIETLDYAEIKNVDLTIRPRFWDINGKSGIKAYLKSMYVTIEEDEFSEKYDDLPEE